MSTVLLYAPALAHTREHHPESHQRTKNVISFLEEAGVLANLTQVNAEPASMEQLTRVHSPALIEVVHAASAEGGGMLDADTYTTAESYELARLAAGGCCLAVEHIMKGKARNGLAVVRPPGHHAERNRPGGFCLFNNVAVAARQAQVVHGAERVLIVDIDVHHGNGTQDIFYEDESVLFVSLHLYHPFFYPGTGALDEIGSGPGKGRNVNVPFPPYVGDHGYKQAFKQLILPAAQQFEPELILVSVGFDAHWSDPLATAALSLSGYAKISQELVSMAESLCDGRILYVLEGGYRIQVLHHGLLNVLHALRQEDVIIDPFGPAPEPEEDVTNLLNALQELHLLN